MMVVPPPKLQFCTPTLYPYLSVPIISPYLKQAQISSPSIGCKDIQPLRGDLTKLYFCCLTAQEYLQPQCISIKKQYSKRLKQYGARHLKYYKCHCCYTLSHKFIPKWLQLAAHIQTETNQTEYAIGFGCTTFFVVTDNIQNLS